MKTLGTVLAAATILAFQPPAGAEETAPSAFLRGDAPDVGVSMTMNAGIVYNDVILLDYADGWARIFCTGSREVSSQLSFGSSDVWIQVSNISAMRFPSSINSGKLDESRAAALELRKKLKEEAAALQATMRAATVAPPLRAAQAAEANKRSAEQLVEHLKREAADKAVKEEAPTSQAEAAGALALPDPVKQDGERPSAAPLKEQAWEKVKDAERAVDAAMDKFHRAEMAKVQAFEAVEAARLAQDWAREKYETAATEFTREQKAAAEKAAAASPAE